MPNPPRPGRRSSPAARSAAVAAALVVAAGCSGGGAPSASPSPGSSSVVVKSVDLSHLPIRRGPFCQALDVRLVQKALGGPVTSTDEYGSGDTVEIVPGHTDVSHEYNCTFTSGSGSQARAWVFAAPVSKERAVTLAHDAAAETGCRRVSTVRFGTPTVSTLCDRPGTPPSTVATMSGLFGDAWFSCQLTQPLDAVSVASSPTRVLERTRSWCVSVATALGARP